MTPMTQRSAATHVTSTRARHEGASWDQPTPPRHDLETDNSILRDREETELEAPSMTLNQFVVRTRKASWRDQLS